jgi:hypothetical protein
VFGEEDVPASMLLRTAYEVTRVSCPSLVKCTMKPAFCVGSWLDSSSGDRMYAPVGSQLKGC